MTSDHSKRGENEISKQETDEVRRAEASEGAAAALNDAFAEAVRFQSANAVFPLRPKKTAEELRARFDIDVPELGRPGSEVIQDLARAAEPGLVGNTRANFFGWVMGASHPVGIAADWLTSAWGQNAATYQTSPSAAVVEETASRWLIDLLRLPAESSVGFTTGATMASFICLAAARGETLRRAGFDLERDGLSGTPPIAILIGADAHASVHSVLRYLGFGRKNIVVVDADDEGRMLADDLRTKLQAIAGPKIIIGQAGHINSGAFDPFEAMAELAKTHDAWLHIDGAFGLWARAAPGLRDQCRSAELADSWAVDGHKWLQVPYDSGFAIVRSELAHISAMETSASYIADHPGDGRNPAQYGPELSRRARGFAVWAVIQALGRKGIANLIEGHCRLAGRLKALLEPEPGITILNEVALNQLAICFDGAGSPDDAWALTDRVIGEIAEENTSFVEGATWKGRRIMRVSIISRATGEEDIDRLGRSIIRAWSRVRANRARRASAVGPT